MRANTAKQPLVEGKPAYRYSLGFCRNTGTIPGLSCSSPTAMVRRAAQGFQFVTGGSDMGFAPGGAAAGLPVSHASLMRTGVGNAQHLRGDAC